MSVFRMSQKEKSEPTFRARLINVKGKGLGWKDQDGVFKPVSNLSIKCVAPIALQVKSLKGKITSAVSSLLGALCKIKFGGPLHRSCFLAALNKV